MDLFAHLFAYLVGTAIYVVGKTVVYWFICGSFLAGFKDAIPSATICFTALTALHVGLTLLQNIA